jgi:metal-responsive CopG/Arc/MetJ family transcriptional regulator
MTTKPVINLVLDPDLLARIDTFWHEQRFNARSEAIDAALTKKLAPKVAPKKEAPSANPLP